MKVLLKFLKPYKKECIIGPFFKLLEAILELLLPTIMILVINNGIAKSDSSYILKMGFVMLLMSVLGFVCSLTCQFNAAKASQGYGTDLRNAMFSHIACFSYAELDHFGTSTLTTRLTSDINQLQLAVAMLIRLVIRAPFICIGAITMAMLLNFKLSLVLIGVTPLFIAILYFVMSRTSPLYKLCQEKLDKLSVVVSESLSGVRVIRAFAKGQHETLRFGNSNDDLTATSTRVAKLSALLSPLTSFIMNMTIVVILWVGGIEINIGNFNQGEMIAYINYITQVLFALIVVSNLIIIFTKAYTSAARVSEILNTIPSIIDHADPRYYTPQLSKPSEPIIVFKDVSFSYYNTADRAVEDINLTIYKGETIGIIGGTGSGKTTLVNLMGRFYEVHSGLIKVDGLTIQDYPLHELRKRISYVPQESVLIRGTIKENLILGNPQATDTAIKRAAKIAQASDFIADLKDGYETQVTRGGQNFSGGQKQRLAIARALVTDPSIIILDDSSSALDFATEAKLRKALKENLNAMTVMMISQRASSIRDCHKIIVMDDGRIVGSGTHSELLENCGIYKEICLSQMSDHEVTCLGGDVLHEA